MNRPDWKKSVPVLLLAAFATAMLWPLIFGGETYIFRDFGRYYVPVKKVYLERLARGELCIWLPQLNCGTPIHGSLIHGFLYPGNLLLFAGETLGWGLYFAAHLFLAGLGARALARKLGAGEEGAFAAAIAYAGSGYLVSQINHVPYLTVAAWAPLIITLGLSAGKGSKRALPLLAGAFALAALGGEPFTLLLTIVFLGVLVLAGHAGARIPALLRIGLAGFVALLLASPALLPAWEVIPESSRAAALNQELKGYGSVHPLRLATLLSPEVLGNYQASYILEPQLFGVSLRLEAFILLGIWFGAVGLVALAFAPVRRSPVARILIGIAAVCGLLALGNHLGLATLLMENVPGLTRFRYPDKFWFLVTLAVTPLVGLALPSIRRKPGLILAGSGCALAIGAALALSRPEAVWTGALPFVFAAASMLLPAPWRVRALTLVLAGELLFFGLRHHVTVEPHRVDSGRSRLGRILKDLEPQRIFVDFKHVNLKVRPSMEEVVVTALSNVESIRGLESGFSYTMGYDPVEPLIRTSQFFIVPRDIPDAEQTARFHRYLRLTANTHSITTVDLRNDREVRQILTGPKGIRCYQYVDPLPRAVLFGDVLFVPDSESAKEKLDDFTFDPFRTLLVEGEGAPEKRGAPRGSVEYLENGDREVRLRVRSDRPAWLFLSDTYARGWEATVDGAPVPIHPAMIAFRAVRVPSGESTVRFRYEPRWLRIAPVTFAMGFLILLGMAWWARRAGRRGNRPDGQIPEDRIPDGQTG